MDVYGMPAPESFRIDDLLDFSNSELFSSSSTAAAAVTTDQSSDLYPHFPSSFTQSAGINLPNKTHITDFTDDLYVPNEEVAELEWLSNFVDDSFTDFSTNELATVVNLQPAIHSRSRSKRSRATSTTNNGWIISSSESNTTAVVKKRDNSSGEQQQQHDTTARRCTHCASEKTPQWRTGPLGPKTLCNACGVRYKSGRLVPEYRPAASPTFVLTQHSNSHRKVMELRRQKEIVKQEQHEHEQQLFHHHHHHLHQYHHHHHHQQQQQQQKNFEVC